MYDNHNKGNILILNKSRIKLVLDISNQKFLEHNIVSKPKKDKISLSYRRVKVRLIETQITLL